MGPGGELPAQQGAGEVRWPVAPPPPPWTPPTPRWRQHHRPSVTAVAAVLAAGVWFAWLGWDHRYYRDAAGQVAGPYRPWQVEGAVLCLAAGTFALACWLDAAAVVLGITIGFLLPWTGWAIVKDDSGTWPVGAVLVLVALAGGSALFAAAGWSVRRLVVGVAVRRRGARRRRSG